MDTPKSENDLDILLQEVNSSRYIGQLTKEEVRHFVANGTIRFFYEGNQIVGFGAWEAINPQWVEIGPFYNLEAFRGKGLGREIVRLLVTLNAGKRLYAVTKNAIVKKMMLKFGFRPVNALELPLPVYRHLISKISVARLLNLGRKLSLDPVAQYVKP